MRGLPWLLAGAAIGAGIAIVVLNDRELDYDTGYDSDTGYDRVEGAARRTFGWGARQSAEGKVGSVVGKIKEGVGRLTEDPDLAATGTVEKFAGEVKDKAGKVGRAVGEAVHDLNK